MRDGAAMAAASEHQSSSAARTRRAIMVRPSAFGRLGQAVENGLAQAERVLGPLRATRGEEMGLRLQDQAILKHLQMIGGERGAGRGDVDDQLRRAGRGRSFRGADAFHDAVAGDAVHWQRSAASG